MEAEIASSTNIWTVLLPVVVGGVLALLGSTIGPLTLQLLSSRQTEQKLRRERFEEMLSALYAHDDWVERQRSTRIFGPEEDNSPSPLNRALLISAVHFPDLLQDLKSLDAVTSSYGLWMLNAKQKRIKGDLVGVNDGFQPAYQPYRQQFSAVMERATGYARDRGKKI